MAVHALDPEAFRILFPAFADETVFPDIRLNAVWGLATGYMGDVDGPIFSGAPLQYALNLLTAHLLQLQDMLAQGTAASGPVTSAQIDKVRVDMAPPPFKNGWQFWLSQTPYGQQLWALLAANSAGGFYIGGLPERDAFRRVGGGFGPGWFRR